jgi:phenylalanyl-tRNA synthetase beta chain
MKVSLNWLKEFVELPATVAELTELLTLAGVEVEGVETHGVAIEKVVVAQVLESVQHPNADRLSVCKVDDGSGEPKQIVCGAKNYKVGDKVPLAQAGAVLPGDFKIKVGKLRGVESQGMMCSGKELGIADDADGLLILPQSARIGAPLSELFPADTILDLEITPNRADLLSYTGIAREVAALTKKDSSFVIRHSSLPTNTDGVVIESPAECPFYTARKISGVKVGASPAWLKQKLEASGVRSINNIVDITNFAMLETGQPLHAFDADKLLPGRIRVELARDSEEFLALDGKTYKLTSQNLVIVNVEKTIAIAGVMGGEETGVTESTTNVILESAYFQPSNIRRTARALGLISDSSYRFERGVDPEGVLHASQRATDLIVELAGGEAAPEVATAGAAPDFRRSVTLRKGRCSQVLGTEVPGAFIGETLTRFGLATSGDHIWNVPSFRQDLTREIDLVEEITRVFGIENIPPRETSRYVESSATDRAHDRDMRLRRSLAAQGFYETRTLSLVDENAVRGFEHAIRLRNSLTSDQTVLRPSLIDGLMRALAHNARAGAKSLRVFELGRVFRADGREERTVLALAMMGPLAEKSWRAADERDADIFDLKGVVASLGLGELAFEPLENPALALAAAIKLDGAQVGCAGKVWPARARENDIAGAVVIAEIELPSPHRAAQKFSAISKFPAVTRDIAFIAPTDVQHAQVAEVLQKPGEPLLAGVELFDVFTDPTGQKVAAGRKSMAYSLTYRAKDRTLTAEEVNAAHARLKDFLKAELDVVFRE